MSEKRTNVKSKKTTKAKPKHQPFGLTILHDDKDIIVVDKINGLETNGKGKDNEKNAQALLDNYVRKGNSRSKNKVFLIDTLDKDTSGILLFAKNPKAKEYLKSEWKNFEKKYLAVINGKMPEDKGTLSSYLIDQKGQKVHTGEESDGGKLAKTSYKTIEANKRYSLIELGLETNIKHQIRVQLADSKLTILGDRIYGKPDKGAKRLALHSYSISIKHPFTKKPMTFETEVPDFLKALVKIPSKKVKKDNGIKKISKKQKAKNLLAKGKQA